MGTILHEQNKDFSGNPEEPYEFFGANEETKSHLHLKIPWNLANLVKNHVGIIHWPDLTATADPSFTLRTALSAIPFVSDLCGVDVQWWADSMECCCYLRNVQDHLSDGKTLYERRFGLPFNGPVIPFGAMLEYHRISAEDLSRLHQFGPNVLPGIFLGYVLSAGGIWKGDIMVADIEELEEKDASELHARRLNAKEVLTPMKW